MESFETAASADLPGGAGNDDEDSANLPSLEEQLKKIPEETRRVLDELLRAQFTRVRRIDPNKLH